MRMCFLKPWKKLFPTGLFVISVWDGQGSTTCSKAVLSLSEIQWARGGFCYKFAQCLFLEPGSLPVRALQDVPRLPLHGTAGDGNSSTCLGDAWYCLQKRGVPPPWPSKLPALSARVRDGKARGGGKHGEGAGTGVPTFSRAVSNLSQSFRQFINACMFPLPNLDALWKMKGLLDQHILDQTLNMQGTGSKPTKQYFCLTRLQVTPNSAIGNWRIRQTSTIFASKPCIVSMQSLLQHFIFLSFIGKQYNKNEISSPLGISCQLFLAA